MPIDDATNELIASYSVLKAWPLFGFFVLLAAVLLWGWSSAITDPRDFFNFGAYSSYCLIMATLLFVWYLLPRLRFLLRQLLSAKRAAMWVERGSLIYLDRRFFSIPCDQIASLSSDVFGTFNQGGINIRRKDGREKILPTGALAESPEMILRRLSRFCEKGALPDHSLRDDVP